MTEHERREREAWLRDRAIAASRNGIIVTDPNLPDNPIVYVSPGFERITGYSEEEVLGRNCRFLQGEDRDQPALKELRVAIEEGRECRVVLRNYKKDGAFFWNELSVSPVYDEEGSLVNFVGVQDDVTERKFYEEALRDSEERYKALYENNTSMYFTLDKRKTVLSVNRSGAEQLGYAPEALVGRSVLDIFHEEDEESVSRRLDACLRDPDQTDGWEARKVRKDGSTIWVQENIRVVQSPEEDMVVLVVCEDITERKQAERELEIRTHQQAVVAELGVRALAASNLYVLMDEAVAAVARTLNMDCCEVLELLPDGSALLLRSGMGWREGLVGEATVGVSFDSQAGRTLLSGEPVIVEEPDAEGGFDEPAWFRGQGMISGISVPIHGRDRSFGVLGAHAASHRSCTEDDVNFLQAVANVLATAAERDNAEKTLRKVREAERRRMARDLHDEALQDLVEAMRAMRDTSKKSEPQLEAELQKEIGTLERAILGLRGAIYDLRLNEDRERTFVGMLESLVDLHRQVSPEREVELAVDEGLVPPLTRTKQVELLRIVQEALTNVRRHSEARRIRVAVETSGGKLRAEVSDDGRGWDPSDSSAGMGITGMRERARVLGGNLTVTSEPGAGTVVRFELSLAKDREEPEEARILLVEDHASFRQATASVFDEEPEFTVVGQAGSLDEARRMLEGEPVDVAVVDLALPDGYGWELIKDLREANPQAQALVLSASLDRAEMARSVESGAAGVLHKSADMDEIVEAVRRLRAGETLLPLEEVIELLRFAGSKREQEYEARQTIAQLTPREKEVLRALAEGLDVEEIAERLHISTKTERNHVASIFAKLGVHSRLQALVFALRHGVVSVR